MTKTIENDQGLASFSNRSPLINLRLDPATRSPRTDEYSVGVDREICHRLAVVMAYIARVWHSSNRRSG